MDPLPSFPRRHPLPAVCWCAEVLDARWSPGIISRHNLAHLPTTHHPPSVPPAPAPPAPTGLHVHQLPWWRRDSRAGHLRHHAVRALPHQHTVRGPGSQHGLAAAGGWGAGRAALPAQRTHHGAPTHRRRTGKHHDHSTHGLPAVEWTAWAAAVGAASGDASSRRSRRGCHAHTGCWGPLLAHACRCPHIMATQSPTCM